MKNILKYLFVAVLFAVVTSGCTTYKSYTYNVETGDKIAVKLKTGNGYQLNKDSNSDAVDFEITKSGEVQSQGVFIYDNYYDQYVNNAKNDSSSTIIEEKSKNGITYVFYNYNNQEFNYIIKIDNSSTAIILGNSVSESSAKEVFNRLSFSKK